jgi:inward rectifier potassium channel
MAHRKIRRRLATRIRAFFSAQRRKTPRSRLRSLGGRRIVADGLEQAPWTDVYHNAMTASWPAFFGALAVAFVAVNMVFAFVYAVGDEPIANARPGSLSDLFFFSVETTSRPRAQLIFARNPVIADHDGTPTLIFRVANARSAFISEASAKLWMLRATTSMEGRRFVGFQPLRLIKAENPTFALSWTLFHPIDADSPLAGTSESELLGSETNFVVSIRGFDESAAQTVHARHTFTAQDLRPGHEFVDIHSIDENGMRHIDYAKIHDTRPVAPQPISPSRDIANAPSD